jgi:hypothetical protein
VFQNNTVWYISPYENATYEFSYGPGNTIIELHYIQYIRRKSTYYVWVLIAPTFIITALSLAGLYSPFNNEGGREEKVQFCGSFFCFCCAYRVREKFGGDVVTIY